MEILVVTSACTTIEHNTDVLAQVQWIADTLHNAPGLISSRFYQNRENSSSYLMFTTWEDEESWLKAQERYNPKTLLQSSATKLLAEPPEQWRMHYLWGYNRPAVTATVVAVHLTTVPIHQAEASQQKWMNELCKQDLKHSLGFAFLARGKREETAGHKEKPPFAPAIIENHLNSAGPVFLNFLSWGSEAACRKFYASPTYKELDIFIRSTNAMQHILLLESMR
jgi:quinol monooxygenase YgiN